MPEQIIEVVSVNGWKSVERVAVAADTPILGGLHHEYRLEAAAA